MHFYSRIVFPLFIFQLVAGILVFSVMTSCSKEENKNDIPVVAVSFVINPNSTEYLELNAVGGWVNLTGGYRGIVIYRKSVSEFMAYERACPYDWDLADGRVDVDASGLTARCPACKSQYILIDGSPFAGPSTYPLKQYQTQYDGIQLYVFN